MDNIAMLAVVIGGVVFVLALANVNPVAVLNRAAVRLLGVVRGWIPRGSAESAALFRIVFGSALLVFLLRSPFVAAWASDPTNVVSDAQQDVLEFFSAAPWSVNALKAWVTLWGVLVIIGAATRMSFAMLTVGAVTWSILYTTHVSHHTVSALLMALVCLLWARWGDAWSVDAWLHRRHPERRAPPQEYGYAVWVPGFVLGVAFAAAAFSKLWGSGLAWILNGTVKYHFLSDSDQAMVDWGLQLGRYPHAAVALSFAAVFLEMSVVVGVICGVYRYRLLAGVAAFSLLAGFALFQGVLWPGWWILLLSFLPWHRLKPPVDARDGSDGTDSLAPTSWRRALQPAGAVVLILLLIEQCSVSILGLERSPLISAYDMYSATYSSPASYEAKARQYWVVAVDDASRVHECRVGQEQANLVVHDAAGASEVLRRCFQLMRLSSVGVDVSQAAVDWERWRLNPPGRIHLMDPVPADALE